MACACGHRRGAQQLTMAVVLTQFVTKRFFPRRSRVLCFFFNLRDIYCRCTVDLWCAPWSLNAPLSSWCMHIVSNFMHTPRFNSSFIRNIHYYNHFSFLYLLLMNVDHKYLHSKPVSLTTGLRTPRKFTRLSTSGYQVASHWQPESQDHQGVQSSSF